MSLQLKQHLMSAIGELRFEPLQTRLRAWSGGAVVVDCTSAVLVWEPKRVVATYAVPVAGVLAELVEAPQRSAASDLPVVAMLGGPQVYDPRTPFSVHTTGGTSYDLRTPSGRLNDAAFRLDDPALDGVVALDFEAFDRWLDEDEEVVGHPRDPFHRIDVRPSSRHVEVRLAGQSLAASEHVHVLTETMLPTRYYFPRDDVQLDRLAASDTRTACAYKGHATYFSLPDTPDGDDIAWTYPAPLHDAQLATDEVAFFNERVDVFVDGELQEQPATPWSR